MNLKIGDAVYWDSQSRGSWKEKAGTVVGIVPPGAAPEQFVPDSSYSIPVGHGQPRAEESYLVQVGKSRRLYWPRTGDLYLEQ